MQYILENDSFDSVQELIRFYIGQRKPISQSGGAHIYCPVSRTLPLRYLEATFALSNSKHGSAYSPSSQRGTYIKRRSVTMTDGLTTEKIIPHRWVGSRPHGRTFSFVFVLFWYHCVTLASCHTHAQWLRQSQSTWDTTGTNWSRTGTCVRLQVVCFCDTKICVWTLNYCTWILPTILCSLHFTLTHHQHPL